MKIPLNKGFNPYWLTKSESDTRPVPTRTGDIMIFPAFIEKTTREEEDPETKEKKTKTVYTYYPVELKYKGDNLNDYNGIKRNRWDEFREHFYGIPWAQSEMTAKGQWTLHAMAVRALFPKNPGELPEGLIKFHDAYKSFWKLISATCQAYHIPYEVIPEYFDCDFMMHLATAYGITGDALTMLITKFQFIVNDLTARTFTWTNLFPRPSISDLVDLLAE